MNTCHIYINGVLTQKCCIGQKAVWRRIAKCFLIEADGIPIGECWLQKMNLHYVRAMHPDTSDVRRIDRSIGEKAYWNKGIGTQLIGMMIEFAFCNEYVEVLHCLCEDYNIRSKRMWEKHGFKLTLESVYKGEFDGYEIMPTS